jgi:membrane-associated phospholipid phosphatase
MLTDLKNSVIIQTRFRHPELVSGSHRKKSDYCHPELSLSTDRGSQDKQMLKRVQHDVLMVCKDFKNILPIVMLYLIPLLGGAGVGRAQNLDINLLRKINADSSKIADRSFLFFSRSVAPVTYVTPIAMLYVGSFNENGLLTRCGYKQALSVLVAGAIGSSLKLIIKRPRPFKTYDFIHAKDRVGPNSFPSNHTAFAFATATSLSMTFPKWYVIGPAYLFAGLAAYSRMYLGVHFPIDVLGGVVIGIGSSLLVWEVDRVMNGK